MIKQTKMYLNSNDTRNKFNINFIKKTTLQLICLQFSIKTLYK